MGRTPIFTLTGMLIAIAVTGCQNTGMRSPQGSMPPNSFSSGSQQVQPTGWPQTNNYVNSSANMSGTASQTPGRQSQAHFPTQPGQYVPQSPAQGMPTSSAPGAQSYQTSPQPYGYPNSVQPTSANSQQPGSLVVPAHRAELQQQAPPSFSPSQTEIAPPVNHYQSATVPPAPLPPSAGQVPPAQPKVIVNQVNPTQTQPAVPTSTMSPQSSQYSQPGQVPPTGAVPPIPPQTNMQTTPQPLPATYQVPIPNN